MDSDKLLSSHMTLYLLRTSAILLLTLAVSCAVPYQPENNATDIPGADSLTVSVVFRASGGEGTKLTGVRDADESHIGRWTVFAFNDHTGHFRWESSASGSPLTLQLTAGQRYTCFAMVNYPTTGVGAFDPSSVRVPADITEKVAYLGDNGEQSLLMFGLTSLIPMAGEQGSVTIGVSRLVSRIDLRGLAVDSALNRTLPGKPLPSAAFTSQTPTGQLFTVLIILSRTSLKPGLPGTTPADGIAGKARKAGLTPFLGTGA